MWIKQVLPFVKTEKKIKSVVKISEEKPVSTVLVAYLMHVDSPYEGYALLQTLTCLGFCFNEKIAVFTWVNPSHTNQVITIANAYQPGVFHIDGMGCKQYKGVVVFMELLKLGVAAPNACSCFIRKVQQLQFELGALCMTADKSIVDESVYTTWHRYADAVARKALAPDLFD